MLLIEERLKISKMLEMANRKQWDIDHDNKLVKIKKSLNGKHVMENDNDLPQTLHRLTNYVSFLEN